jgi:hypothetical protein
LPTNDPCGGRARNTPFAELDLRTADTGHAFRVDRADHLDTAVYVARRDPLGPGSSRTRLPRGDALMFDPSGQQGCRLYDHVGVELDLSSATQRRTLTDWC